MAVEAAERGATEVHIVGGLHPHWPLDHYVEMCARIREACPRLHIKAFTAVEIAHFARLEGADVEKVLRRLIAAGSVFATFHFVALGWVFFALPTPHDSLTMLARLFGLGG